MKNRTIFLFFSFIFLSRVFLLSISPSFFDAPEYLKLFQSQSLTQSLKEVHYPIHPLYIAVGWIFNRIIPGSALLKQELLNSIVGLFSVILIFKILRLFFKDKISMTLTLLASFAPFFWLSQINVMYEPLLCLFLLTSFYFLAKCIKTGQTILIHLSALFFSFSFLVSSTSLIYLVFFFGFLLSKRKIKLSVLWLLLLLLYLLPAITFYLFILKLRGLSFEDLLFVLTSGNGILIKLETEGIMFFARLLKNSFIVYFHSLSIPIGLTIVFFTIKDYIRKKNRILILSWLVSFLLLNSFWHAGMYGRLTLLLTIFPLIYLAKIKNNFLLGILLIFFFTLSFLKVFPYRFYKVPDVLEKEYLEKFPGNPLVVVGNLEEPFLCEKLSCIILNSPKTDLAKAGKEIKYALQNKRAVLFTSQAISAPYFQYDGASYQILSRRKNHPETDGEKMIKEYRAIPVKEFKEFKITIYSLQDDSICLII